MMRWTSLALGAATFLAAHAVEVVMWTAWFAPEFPPFFTNSGRAVAFTTACVLIGGLLAGLSARDRRDVLIHAGNVTAGAAIAMAGALFWSGPGTLFPIVMVLGIVQLAVASFLGALATLPFKSASGGAGGVRSQTWV
jgi:predicted Na+-dependent transporter